MGLGPLGTPSPTPQDLALLFAPSQLEATPPGASPPLPSPLPRGFLHPFHQSPRGFPHYLNQSAWGFPPSLPPHANHPNPAP